MTIDGPYTPHNQEWGTIISLDGIWEIAEGLGNNIPARFTSTIPVPGMVTNAIPSFKDVGAITKSRDAFWYRRKFTIEGNVPAIARLKIFKAMHGATVFLNGKKIGYNPVNFVPLYFNVSSLLKGNKTENELIIRIGADISQVPDSVVSGGDPERRRYPPGIYDHVQLILSADPYVVRTQVVPDVKARQIKAVVYFRADKKTKLPGEIKAEVYEYKTGKRVAGAIIRNPDLKQGQETTLNVDLPIDECKLWTPEEPHLYVLRLENNDYSYQTRFGMRSFEVDSAYTNRALLNGRPSFIRGTNFSIHRFFEDSLSKRHPWDTAWVRKLFRTFREMDMNAIRMVIGPAPELWYDIADEEGMMIFDEYAVWYAYQPDVGDVKDELADPYKRWSVWPKNLKANQLIKEYTAWMQERWNHPSVIVWDAQNESWSKETGEAIRAVRKLDLSNRVWDNGWSPPESKSDIREAHPYFESYTKGSEMQKPNEIAKKPFDLSFLATADKIPSTFYLPYQYAYKMQPDSHWDQPCIINEYSYLWLNRDGTATILTKPFYDAVLGENATSDQRRELYARYLAAVTEYWRANRTCIGVLYPFGLAASITEGATNDNFIDISKLEFDKYYKKYVPDAFASLGVCAELWQTDFPINTWQGTQADFAVAVINDTGKEYNGTFDVVITRGDSVVQRSSYTYSVLPYGIIRRQVKIELPKIAGAYEVIVQLHGGDRIVSSRRKINMFQK